MKPSHRRAVRPPCCMLASPLALRTAGVSRPPRRRPKRSSTRCAAPTTTRCARCSAPTGSASFPPTISARQTSTPSSPPGRSSTRSPRSRQRRGDARRRRQGLDTADSDRQERRPAGGSTRAPARTRCAPGASGATSCRRCRRSSPTTTRSANIALKDRDGNGVLEYAQKFVELARQVRRAVLARCPGKDESPLGPLFASEKRQGARVPRLPLQDPQGTGQGRAGRRVRLHHRRANAKRLRARRLAGALRRHRRHDLHGQPRRHRGREGSRPQHRRHGARNDALQSG